MTHLLGDIMSEQLDVVFCGINPGLTAAASGHHFAGRGNRFWRVIHLAGFTPDQIDPRDDHTILQYKCGLTTLVERATAGADELSPAEFRMAGDLFERKIARYAPRYVAFLGKAAYGGMSGQRDIPWGRQQSAIAGAAVWIVPNPSGRNRAFRLDQLVAAYRELYRATRPASSDRGPLTTNRCGGMPDQALKIQGMECHEKGPSFSEEKEAKRLLSF